MYTTVGAAPAADVMIGFFVSVSSQNTELPLAMISVGDFSVLEMVAAAAPALVAMLFTVPCMVSVQYTVLPLSARRMAPQPAAAGTKTVGVAPHLPALQTCVAPHLLAHGPPQWSGSVWGSKQPSGNCVSVVGWQ